MRRFRRELLESGRNKNESGSWADPTFNPITMRNGAFRAMLVLLCWTAAAPAWAADCRVDRGDGSGLILRLGPNCTDQERSAHAVQARNIAMAIKEGKAIDLSGVVVTGDLTFDDLPLGPFPTELGGEVSDSGGTARTVPVALSIVDSFVKGSVRHDAGKEFLVMRGALTLSGTTFEQPLDLSRTVFVEPVTLSGAVFLRESYFVNARFLRGLFAEKTAFGPHTRFHRARFRGAATFQRSGFNGLAEFLEVQFERDADFSRTYFKSGTGFSGSRFHGLVDFSEAQFAREAFFTFTEFDGDASFERATFRSVADFDDVQFHRRDDFSKALFEGEARFARVKRPVNGPPAVGLENAQVQYGITLSLLVFSALLIAYLIRTR
ncbi:MAG TPA: pentapeptide repeat-containing protein [Nitrospira sp.]|nr:pentapeptide repeat-containing protein [Nitrospira sp.]